MKHGKKIAIVTALVMIAVGITVSFCVMAGMDFNFEKINSISFETNTYTVDERFSSVSITGAECDIILCAAEDEKCTVICSESDKIYHSVSVEENTLVIERHDDRKWYEHIGIYWGDMEIFVYLPQEEYAFLYAKNTSGEISISDAFCFENAKIESTSGNVFFCAQVNGDLSVDAVSGEIHIENTFSSALDANTTSGNITVTNVDVKTDIQIKTVSGATALFDVNAKNIVSDATSGEVQFLDVIATENIKIETVSGDIDLHRCDASSLWIKAVSGDVSGLFLSEKNFVIDTTSGSVNVPYSANGGLCEIMTTSGDIEIESRR